MLLILLNSIAFAVNAIMFARYHNWWSGMCAGISFVAIFLAIELDYNSKN
jgi:hypothetical protein